MSNISSSVSEAWVALVQRFYDLRQRVSSYTSSSGGRRPNLVHAVSLRYLLVIPVLLAIATTAILFVHSDVNVAMLFSQCQARARLPGISRVPVLGPSVCFLVSFFGEALDSTSTRAFVAMSVVLSYISALLTVSTIEAARICNGPSVLIAYPTGPWLIFDLVGGAMVWQLVILPAFFKRSKQLYTSEGEDGLTATSRQLVVSEAVAIPVAIALGYVVPSLIMLVTDAPSAIAAWLLFPVYVSLIRQGVRWLIGWRYSADSEGGVLRTFHLESHRPSLLAVYAVPIAVSMLSHGLVLWSLVVRLPDDRKEMTRSTLQFIEIDFIFIVLTVLYWVLVEAGWRVVAVVLAASVVLGPGGGLCVGWIYRERQLGFAAFGGDEDEGGGSLPQVDDGGAGGEVDDEAGNGPGEATPLLGERGDR